jgi:hypothetical protein
MELIEVNNIESQVISKNDVTMSQGNFIEANTKQVTLNHLKTECIIPVYSDNETTIAHADFIEATHSVVKDSFFNHEVLAPNIRISHVIKGRVPSAIGKPLKELTPDEKTIYYQRCAFIIEVPSCFEIINGNKLTLTIGGVRALNQENLYSKRSLEKFKVFIGFKNFVCTNLCISTDGLKQEIRVSTIEELKEKIQVLIQQFDKEKFLEAMKHMSKFNFNELQFAHIIGKMRMYQHLSKAEKVGKLALAMNDNQIGTMVKNYYQDANFSRNEEKELSLWSFYNLMTEANKSSYIDSNLERNANAFEFVKELSSAIQNQSENWFLY